MSKVFTQSILMAGKDFTVKCTQLIVERLTPAKNTDSVLYHVKYSNKCV